jgi:hypothetical protein
VTVLPDTVTSKVGSPELADAAAEPAWPDVEVEGEAFPELLPEHPTTRTASAASRQARRAVITSKR